MVAVVAGSIRVTRSSSLFATQIAPSPNAIATGVRPTLIVSDRTFFERARVEPCHARLGRVRDPDQAAGHDDRRRRLVDERGAGDADIPRIDPHHRRIAVHPPDRAAADVDGSELRRRSRNVERVGHPLELRIDARQLAALTVRHPDRVRAEGDTRRRPVAQRDRRGRRPLRRADSG